MNRLKAFLHRYALTLGFVIICILGFFAAGFSFGFLTGELYSRIVRNAVTILSLLIPIMAGMGLNFAIIIGAMVSQLVMILVTDWGVAGLHGILLALVLTLALSALLGDVIGRLLNRAKGREMITGIVVGLVGTNLYQLLFLVGFGTLIHPRSPGMLLSRGIGLRNMVDILPYKRIFLQSPLVIFLIIGLVALIVSYIRHTRLGRRFRALGEGLQTARLLGIDVDRTRRQAIMISTMLAGTGHLMFILEMGNINVYTGHLNIDIFSCAALLAGGASLQKAGVRHALLGLVLFHTLFIVSPLAGQNLFNNAAIGEYFRSFAAYGTIVLALIFNQRRKNTGKETAGSSLSSS